MKVYLVKTFGGGHGQGSQELVGCFDELTPELKKDADKNWWSITEYEVEKYKESSKKSACLRE